MTDEETGPKQRSGPNPWNAIIISIASLLVSFTTVYLTHFHTSESVYILLLHSDPEAPMIQVVKGGEEQHEYINFNIGLVNSGNQNIIISSLDLIPPPDFSDKISIRARHFHDDSFVTPILLSPRAVQQLIVRFPLEGAPFLQVRNRAEFGRQLPFKLRFTTIGSSGKLRESEVGVLVIMRDADKSMFPPSPLPEPMRIR